MTDRADNFNRSDGSIGTPSDAGSAWIVGAGTWTVFDNKGQITGEGVASLEADVADVEVQVTIASAGGADSFGAAVRVSDSSNYLFCNSSGGGNATIYKRESGSYSVLATASTGYAAGDTIKLTASGNTLTLYKNGSQILQTTSSLNSSVTKHGLWNYSGTTNYDNLTITGIGGGSSTYAVNVMRSLQVGALGSIRS